MAIKSAHAEAEDDSKMKDRLEVLLCAETLQGTLSPNANPGKNGVKLEAYDIGCHKLLRGFSKQLRHSVTCPRPDLLYQNTPRGARGESKKLLVVHRPKFSEEMPGKIPLPRAQKAQRNFPPI
jgi:hypothetical protein